MLQRRREGASVAYSGDVPAITPADLARGASGPVHGAAPQWDAFLMRSQCRSAAHCSLPALPCPVSGRAAPTELLVAATNGGTIGSSATTARHDGLLSAWGHVPRHARLGEGGRASAWSWSADPLKADGRRPLQPPSTALLAVDSRGVGYVPRALPVLAHLQSGPALLGAVRAAARAFAGWRRKPEASRLGGSGGHSGTGVADAAADWMQ